MSPWAEIATALVGTCVVLVAWVATQRAWRRVFPEACHDPDVLAGRPGCAGSCAHPCPKRPEAANLEEEIR